MTNKTKNWNACQHKILRFVNIMPMSITMMSKLFSVKLVLQKLVTGASSASNKWLIPCHQMINSVNGVMPVSKATAQNLNMTREELIEEM